MHMDGLFLFLSWRPYSMNIIFFSFNFSSNLVYYAYDKGFTRRRRRRP